MICMLMAHLNFEDKIYLKSVFDNLLNCQIDIKSIKRYIICMLWKWSSPLHKKKVFKRGYMWWRVSESMRRQIILHYNHQVTFGVTWYYYIEKMDQVTLRATLLELPPILDLHSFP